MSDLFGVEASKDEFVDIRAQRESVAIEKAERCMELNGLLHKTPLQSRIASIQSAKEFGITHKASLRVCKSESSTRPQIIAAIVNLRRFHE